MGNQPLISIKGYTPPPANQPPLVRRPTAKGQPDVIRTLNTLKPIRRTR